MSDEHPTLSRAQLNFERYRTRLGFWQVIWGTLISGGVAVAIPAAVDAYKARLEIQKSVEDQKLKAKEIEGKILDSHQQYISNFLNTALNQDIELRIRFSEYFAFVSEPSSQTAWEHFRSSLITRRDSIREQINAKEMQLERMRAQRSNLTVEQQIDLSRVERELNWNYAELGYVRRDTNVTAPVATVGAIDRESVSSESESLFKDMVIDRNRLAQINQVVDRIVAAKDRYEAVQTRTGVPWFVVGIIHYLEANGDFSKHLNGDPLSARTVNVPAGRPDNGEPPFAWQDSAIDILKLEFSQTTNFSTIGNILYQFENSNGFGYRRRNVRSPFIWSCTNQYTSGKYVTPHVFDPNVVQKECGAAAILKVMLDRNFVHI
jgi:lysozyme family protein